MKAKKQSNKISKAILHHQPSLYLRRRTTPRPNAKHGNSAPWGLAEGLMVALIGLTCSFYCVMSAFPAQHSPQVAGAYAVRADNVSGANCTDSACCLSRNSFYPIFNPNKKSCCATTGAFSACLEP